jgi:type III secretion protein V
MNALLQQLKGTPFAELGVIGFLLIVLALFIAPLPLWILDALIAFNFVFSLILLITAVQVKNALEFSSFPTLLLFTTVLRLGLTFASTKLILTDAHAAQIIEAFGALVVGGNVVTGLVVFLILIIVQFLVMTKGAERVAEVGARFTLDAMPGKQMSIDADLRAGLITGDQARQMRAELGRESQLHGAMDGAMKFVKGDAIVGFFIALICIIGGIVIGTVQHEMTLSEAAARYTVLTVGEGLVAQLPSLFVAMAAGILITRVGGEEGQSLKVGDQISNQLGRYPFALIGSGSIIFLLGLMPGFPFLVFAVMGGAPVYLGIRSIQKDKQRQASAATPMPAMRRAGTNDTPVYGQSESFNGLLELKVSKALKKKIIPSILNIALSRSRKAMEQAIGLPYPGLSLSFVEDFDETQFEVWSQGAPLHTGQFPTAKIDVKAVTALVPSDNELVIGSNKESEWSIEWHLAMAVARAIQRHPQRLIGLQETQTLINAATANYPDLIAELQREVPISKIAEVLRRLVDEGVSIHPIRDICESLINWAPKEREITTLVELVRIDLGRYIAAQQNATNGLINALILDSETEERLRESIREGNLGLYLALPPNFESAFIQQIEEASATWQTSNGIAPRVLACAFDVRRHVRKVVEKKMPSLTILSFQELAGFVKLHTAGVVRVDPAYAEAEFD